jgi:hypothetical protein
MTDLTMKIFILEACFSSCRLPINSLSVEELYARIAPPMPQPVVRTDGRPYSVKPGVPSHVNLPVWLGEEDVNITLNEAMLLLSDFGTAFRPSDRSTFVSQTPRSIRPPEALFEPTIPLSFGSDIWSLGCIIFEMFAHSSLIDGILVTQDKITAQQVALQGPMPEEWWLRWEDKSKWFDATGKMNVLGESEGFGSWEQRFEDSIQNARRDHGYPTMTDEEKAELMGLLRYMLASMEACGAAER